MSSEQHPATHHVQVRDAHRSDSTDREGFKVSGNLVRGVNWFGGLVLIGIAVAGWVRSPSIDEALTHSVTEYHARTDQRLANHDKLLEELKASDMSLRAELNTKIEKIDGTLASIKESMDRLIGSLEKRGMVTPLDGGATIAGSRP